MLFGKIASGYAFAQQFSYDRTEEGLIKYQSKIGSLSYKGITWVENDSICDQYEKRLLDMKICSDIYFNPDGDATTLSDYLQVTDYTINPFSVVNNKKYE